MNHTKAATLRISTAIATVTLSLVTATVAVVVSMMVPIQTAHASCITSPTGQVACSSTNICPGGPEFACSGGISASCKLDSGCASSGTGEPAFLPGEHNACSSSQGGTSVNPGHSPASPGKGCF
jgi:hypothetical protein